jgi:hypothetical protein
MLHIYFKISSKLEIHNLIALNKPLHGKEYFCFLKVLLGHSNRFPAGKFWMIWAETPCWEIEENSQILNEDFYCRSTFFYDSK